jgi:hypothetical protein
MRSTGSPDRETRTTAGRLASLEALATGALVGGRMGARVKTGVLLSICAVALLGVALLPPISDDPGYQQFADHRSLAGIPNFADVASNLAFLVAGLLGLIFLARRRGGPPAFATAAERWPYMVFFAGVTLCGLGSAFFHLAPDSWRLAVDRAPMTVAFMGFVAAVVADRISPRLGVALLWPLVALGLASVAFWLLGELRGAGDLRPFVLVQYLPMLLVPLVCVLYPSRYTRPADVWGTVALYGLAKLGEVGDAALLGLGHVVSGHTVKHLLAGLAAWWLLRMLERRAPASPGVTQ